MSGFNKEHLTPMLRDLRMNVRNFLLTATLEQLNVELEYSHEIKDTWRARFVEELIEETKRDGDIIRIDHAAEREANRVKYAN